MFAQWDAESQVKFALVRSHDGLRNTTLLVFPRLLQAKSGKRTSGEAKTNDPVFYKCARTISAQCMRLCLASE